MPPYVKSWLIWKYPDAGKDWGQEEKGTTEDEMAGWHHRLNGHGFGWTLGVGDGQGCLVCYGPWGHKELDMTEQLNWTNPYPSQNIRKNWTGENNLKIILWHHHCSDTKPVKYKKKKKRKKENYSGKYLWWIYMQESSTKYYQTEFNNIYIKRITHHDQGIYFSSARMVQHSQVNKCDTPH